MADDLELLKAIRGGHRGVETKLITEAEEILESTFLLTEDYERFFVIYHTTRHKMANAKRLRPANLNCV